MESKKDMHMVLEKDTWIQCDNPKCLKWRRIASEKAQRIPKESKWFCKMNDDTRFNSCSIGQEDFDKWRRLAKQQGLTYVHSTWELGLLVWAKITGYCRWPAVITQDIIGGMYVDFDDDGDPVWYHVEYLGHPHSRGWVQTHCLNVFSHQKGQDNCIVSNKDKVGGRKKKSKKFSPLTRQPRQRYYRSGIQDAIREAESMVNKTSKERLDMCYLQYSVSDEKMTTASMCAKFLGKSIGDVIALQSDSNDRQLETASVQKRKRPVLQKLNDQSISISHPKQPVELEKEKSMPSTEVDFQSFMDFNVPLKDKTKQEKLVIDIQMYSRNKKAFEHDVKRFMLRNGLALKLPLWRGVHIDLFQLFLAVHDRGGYAKVPRKNGGWSGIHKELTGVSGQGGLVKRFYIQNLLPYEEYVHGRDFSSAVQNVKSFRKQVGMEKVKKEPRNITISSHSAISTLTAHDSDMVSLMAEIDKIDEQCHFTISKDNEKESQNEPFKISYYGDSPQVKTVPNFKQYAELEFECHTDHTLMHMPDELHSEDTSTFSEQVYQELKALEDQLDEYDSLLML